MKIVCVGVYPILIASLLMELPDKDVECAMNRRDNTHGLQA